MLSKRRQKSQSRLKKLDTIVIRLCTLYHMTFCMGNLASISSVYVTYFLPCNLYGIVININCIICQNTVLKAVQLSHKYVWNFQFSLPIHHTTFY